MVARFLSWARSRSRTAHLAAYEDLGLALDDLMRRRPGPRLLRPAEVRPLVGAWYRTTGGALGPEPLRRFCAALRVFARWQSRETGSSASSSRVRDEAACAARATVRAAVVTELLDRTPSGPAACRGTALCDGYWQVVLLGSDHAVLREVGSAEALGPVQLPRQVVSQLRPGSILNLCIAADGRRWRVVQHGRCYPALAPGALRAQAGPGPA